MLSPLIGLETGSVRMARLIMPGKAAPFSIEHWPDVVIQGLTVLNRNNWFPVMTLMIGNPGETDGDVMATLDLVYEMERRGLFAFLVPSIFYAASRHTHGEEEGGYRYARACLLPCSGN